MRRTVKDQVDSGDVGTVINEFDRTSKYLRMFNQRLKKIEDGRKQWSDWVHFEQDVKDVSRQVIKTAGAAPKHKQRWNNMSERLRELGIEVSNIGREVTDVRQVGDNTFERDISLSFDGQSVAVPTTSTEVENVPADAMIPSIAASTPMQPQTPTSQSPLGFLSSRTGVLVLGGLALFLLARKRR